MASSPETQANYCENAGSSGWMGRFSFKCFKVWCSQAEALYHHILGLFSKLQYRHAKATLGDHDNCDCRWQLSGKILKSKMETDNGIEIGSQGHEVVNRLQEGQ